LSCGRDPVLLTGSGLDEGLLWVCGITDVVGHPVERDLIATKRGTQARLPTSTVWWHVIARATIQGKADRTSSPEGRNGQDTFPLGSLGRCQDPVLWTRGVG